ncbi:MAG: alkaline phosphatase family protein [bacterium]|nr:alkaline phosphatase family protein [bacterium]
MGKRRGTLIALLAAVLAARPDPAAAYIGPGAGFAFLGSFVFILGGLLFALAVLLTLPARLLARRIRSRRRRAAAKVGRVVIVGFDGMDPELAEAFMAEGKLPNLARLARDGSYARLGTTNPPISPVAWSTFMTGSDPGKHAIFDFLRREPGGYLPGLSSADIRPPRRSIRLGPYRIPIGKPRIRMLRRGVPFWKTLGEHGVPAAVLKVPITFPPERFRGLLLSGLCTPDLKGSQGTFAFYTNGDRGRNVRTGGYAVRLEGPGPVFETAVSGPRNPFRDDGDLSIPMRITVDAARRSARLRIGAETFEIAEGELSDWIPLTFRAPFGVKVRGIAQAYLRSAAPAVELYLSPVQIDPERPSLPVSHPVAYSVYLAKVLGPFATLGLPQDTWALNEGVLTDEAFLEQAYRIHDWLEAAFFHTLAQVREGLVCCVFDTTDVIQHEFWRYIAPGHPALRGGGASGGGVIEDLYRRMDALVGRLRERLGPRDLLLILSDHGFKLFSRGFNLNSWLVRNGYLVLRDGAAVCGEWFEGVDWSRTRAYALGLAGLFLNRRGREPRGIVERGDAAALKAELSGKLAGLVDGEKGATAIAAVYDAAEIYSGPYAAEGPDLIIGYAPGWRVSWESVTGRATEEIFIDNEKAWSADHCIDHRFVPGVFFCSGRIASSSPHLRDIAPTVLDLFGVAPPASMDGAPLGVAAAEGRP